MGMFPRLGAHIVDIHYITPCSERIIASGKKSQIAHGGCCKIKAGHREMGLRPYASIVDVYDITRSPLNSTTGEKSQIAHGGCGKCSTSHGEKGLRPYASIVDVYDINKHPFSWSNTTNGQKTRI